MKKIKIFMLALACSLSLGAEDILQVVPFQAQPGAVENNWDETLTFSVNLNCTHPYTTLQFDLFLPEGMELLDDANPFDASKDRFPGTEGRYGFTTDHDISCTKKGDGHYLVVLYDNDLQTINGTEGELLKFYYTTSADMKEGVYPITVSNTVMVYETEKLNSDGTKVLAGVQIPSSTSFVQIGNAKGGLVLTGEIPSFVSDKLGNEVVTGLDLTNATHIHGSLQMEDGIDYTMGDSTAVDEVSYVRTYDKTFDTVCLPFEVSSNDDVTYFVSSGFQDGSLFFEPVDVLPANTPAIYWAADRKLSVTSRDVVLANDSIVKSDDVDVNGWGLVGTYQSLVLDPSNSDKALYSLDDETFVATSQSFCVSPFKAWFQSSLSDAVSQVAITLPEDNADGLQGVENAVDAMKVVYDMTGRRLSCERKNAVNIVNGKKLFLK